MLTQQTWSKLLGRHFRRRVPGSLWGHWTWLVLGEVLGEASCQCPLLPPQLKDMVLEGKVKTASTRRDQTREGSAEGRDTRPRDSGCAGGPPRAGRAASVVGDSHVSLALAVEFALTGGPLAPQKTAEVI